MAITHSVVKVPGQTLGAVADWNAGHTVTDPHTAKRSATLIVAANNSLDTTRADYFCDGAADEVQINQAIAALPATGGRVLLMDGTYTLAATITMNKAKVTLAGQGGSTIILSNVNAITLGANDCTIRDLTIDLNGTGQRGINVTATSFRTMILYCYIKDWAQNYSSAGIYAGAGFSNSIIEGCLIDGGNYKYGDGIEINYISHFVKIVNNTVEARSGSHGIYLKGQTGLISGNSVGDQHAPSVTIETNTGTYGVITNNYVAQAGNGKVIIVNGTKSVITNNIAFKNAKWGIYLKNCGDCIVANHYIDARYPVYCENAPRNLIVGNRFYGDSTFGVYFDANSYDNIVTANHFIGGYIDDNGADNVVFGNSGLALVQEKMFRKLKNVSGGVLVAGDVVILNASAAGDEVTTTNVQGHDRVWGMIAESINNAAYGRVQDLGKTVVLKVNGVVDIAIGDFIGTHTDPGIGMKAAAGDMAIAIALEAYTGDDSNGVIDALLITQRKI